MLKVARFPHHRLDRRNVKILAREDMCGHLPYIEGATWKPFQVALAFLFFGVGLSPVDVTGHYPWC